MNRYSSLLFVVAFFSVQFSFAQSYNPLPRGGLGESTLMVSKLNSRDIGFKGGAELAVDKHAGWGFSFGYNVDNHLKLSFEHTFNQPRYQATIVSADAQKVKTVVNHRMSLYTGQFNLTYHLLPSALTPYVDLGAGWTYMDSNIVSGPASFRCWRSPWGYRCGYIYPSYSRNSFSYGAALGIRWDISNEFFVRSSIANRRIKWRDSTENPEVYSGRIEVGWMFD